MVKKESVSPWDILEGHKSAGPLNLSWFGAVRLERKASRYEEQHRYVAVCDALNALSIYICLAHTFSLLIHRASVIRIPFIFCLYYAE